MDKGAFAGFAILAPAPAQQDGGWGVAVGDSIHMHGHKEQSTEAHN